MAEGYLKGFLIGKAEIYSAGVENHTINKNAIKIMKDDGVDISQNESNHISEFEKIDFDFIITVCVIMRTKHVLVIFQKKLLKFIKISLIHQKLRMKKN